MTTDTLEDFPLPDGPKEWQEKLEWLKLRRLIYKQSLDDPPGVKLYIDSELLARKDLEQMELAPDTDKGVWHLTDTLAEELGLVAGDEEPPSA